MIKSAVDRNARSHGRAIALATGNTYVRNPAKLAAGRARFHITVLSPDEYAKISSGKGSTSSDAGSESNSGNVTLEKFKQ